MMLARGVQLALAECTLFMTSPALSRQPVRLEGSAPTILSDLVRRWTTEFDRSQCAIQVEVPPPYDPPKGALSPALAAFLAGRLDFAFLSRKMSDSDIVTFRKAHGYEPVIIPVVGGSWNSFGFVDPVVVIVNSKNPVRALSFAQLDAIFSKSRRRGHRAISSWDEVGGSSNQAIHVVGGANWSGEDSARGGVFRERVMLGGAWRDDPEVRAGGTESEVPAAVAADPSAIGFTGLGHLKEGDRPLALRQLARGRAVAPTYSAVAAGRYPLSRTIDLVVARKPGTCLSRELRNFVRYLIGSVGQDAVRAEGRFLPLTHAQARDSWLRAASCR